MIMWNNAKIVQRKRNARPPEQVKRERTLSIGWNNTLENEVSEQSNFHLFKLPLEIREMIYAEMLPFERVWIVLIDKRLVCDWELIKAPVSKPNSNDSAGDTSIAELPAESSTSTLSAAAAQGATTSQGAMTNQTLVDMSSRKPRGPAMKFRIGVPSKTPMWGLGILSLLRTCRRVYSDVIPYLYSKPTFSFQDTLPFLAFVASIPPSHFQHIRSVTINLATPDLPRHLQARLNKVKEPAMTIPRPEVSSLKYAFFYDGSFPAPLYNASILPPQNPNKLLPSYMWDAIANALEEMKSLRQVRITLLNVPRRICVWVEHGYEGSGQRDAQDIMDSLKWVGRARPWKGEVDEPNKGREAEVVFENVWWKTDREHKKQGHWVRQVDENGRVEWNEVGEAAGAVLRVGY